MYYTKWVEPENYSKRQFFNKYGQWICISDRYILLNYNRQIRGSVESFVKLANDRVGVMYGIDLHDALFLESLFFRIVLSDGRIWQLELNIKKTTLFRLAEMYLYKSDVSGTVNTLFLGKLSLIWKVLFKQALEKKEFNISDYDKNFFGNLIDRVVV